MLVSTLYLTCPRRRWFALTVWFLPGCITAKSTCILLLQRKVGTNTEGSGQNGQVEA